MYISFENAVTASHCCVELNVTKLIIEKLNLWRKELLSELLVQYWVTCDHDNAGGSTPLFGRHTAWEIWPGHCRTATIEVKLSNTPAVHLQERLLVVFKRDPQPKMTFLQTFFFW